MEAATQLTVAKKWVPHASHQHKIMETKLLRTEKDIEFRLFLFCRHPKRETKRETKRYSDGKEMCKETAHKHTHTECRPKRKKR